MLMEFNNKVKLQFPIAEVFKMKDNYFLIITKKDII